MTCLEYANEISDFGNTCKLPTQYIQEITRTRGYEKATDVNNFGTPISKRLGNVTVTKYSSCSVSDGKKKEMLLQEMTKRAMTSNTDNGAVFRFYKWCMVKFPKQYRNGEYVYQEWLDFLCSFIETINAELIERTGKERFTKSSNVNKVLFTRLDEWQARAAAKASETENTITAIKFEDEEI